MKQSVKWSVLLGLSFMCVQFLHAQGNVTTNSQDRLLSVRQDTHEQSNPQAGELSQAKRDELLMNLRDAVKNHRENCGYLSPLHSAILAVVAGHVKEAEDILINIVDYKLDSGTFHDGLDVYGDSFYPAARALVDLQVETGKVMRAIRLSMVDEKLQLLTWVLRQRAGSSDEAKRLLNAEVSNESIQKALKLLSRSGNAAELLLPRPIQTFNSNGGFRTNTLKTDWIKLDLEPSHQPDRPLIRRW